MRRLPGRLLELSFYFTRLQRALTARCRLQELTGSASMFRAESSHSAHDIKISERETRANNSISYH